MTAATAAPAPGPPITGPESGADADDTTARADFRAWEHQLTADGTCSHPIQLHHRTDMIDLATGELDAVYGQATVACGNRREAVCPSCSQVYKRDARQLVRAGLAGGKGIPETITAHPCVFATLTAPSFGPVHARRLRGKTVLPCRPRRDAKARRCPHGRDISCPTRHAETDPRLGQPMCPDCYDYTAAVLFNAYAGDLWRRFITYLPRHLARLAGVTQKMLHAQVRIRFVKVAYGGHFLTKSRRYSVTFGQLRAARAEHRRATRPTGPGRDAWGRPLDETVVLVLGTTWTYTEWHVTVTPGAELAAASAARAREHPDPADHAA